MGNTQSEQQKKQKLKEERNNYAQVKQTQLRFYRDKCLYHLQYVSNIFVVSKEKIYLTVYDPKNVKIFKGAFRFEYLYFRQKYRFQFNKIQEVFKEFKKNVSLILPNLSLFSLEMYLEDEELPMRFPFVDISESQYAQLQKANIKKIQQHAKLAKDCLNKENQIKEIKKQSQIVYNDRQKQQEAYLAQQQKAILYESLLKSLEQEQKKKDQEIKKLKQSKTISQKQIQKLTKIIAVKDQQASKNQNVQQIKQDLYWQKVRTSKLQRTIEQKEFQVKNIKQKLEENQSKQNLFKKKANQFEQKYDQAKTDLEKYIKLNQGLNLQIQTLGKQKSQKERQIHEKESKQKQIQRKSLIIIDEKQKNQNQLVKQKQRSKLLTIENQNLKTQMSNVQDSNVQIGRLKLQIQQIQAKLTQAQDETTKLKKQIQIKENLLKTKAKSEQQQKQNENIIIQFKKLDQLIKKEVQWKNQQILLENNVKNKQDQLEQSKKKYQNQIKKLQGQCQEKMKQIQQNWKQKMIITQNDFNYKIKQITEKYQNQTQSEGSQIFNEQLNKIREQYQAKFIVSFFTGDCFEFGKNNHVEKKYLIQKIEEFQQAKIKATVLLYRKDEESNVNFHYYVDNRPNFVLIIKLRNGHKIAAYSRHPIQKGNNPSTGGLIMSLSNLKTFELKTNLQKCNAVVYDQYFIIFGNSQVRLRFKQQMLFSNFGILNSYYDCKGQKVNILLNQQKERQSAIQSYEIFQIKF